MTPPSELSWRGRTVLVLGGSTEGYEGLEKDGRFEFLSEDEYDIRIEEAGLALTRAVLARGGRVVFRDDPVFTPLFIEVALEYWEALPAEEAPADRERRRFVIAPLVMIAMHENGVGYASDALDWASKVGCLETVSDRVIAERDADLVVLIGGSKAASEDFDRLANSRLRGAPVVALPSTGGVARAVVEQSNVRDAEAAILERANSGTSRFEPPPEFVPRATRESDPEAREQIAAEPERVPEFRYALYPLVIATLLDGDEQR
jgi:hypothetical protein